MSGTKMAPARTTRRGLVRSAVRVGRPPHLADRGRVAYRELVPPVPPERGSDTPSHPLGTRITAFTFASPPR